MPRVFESTYCCLFTPIPAFPLKRGRSEVPRFAR